MFQEVKLEIHPCSFLASVSIIKIICKCEDFPVSTNDVHHSPQTRPAVPGAGYNVDRTQTAVLFSFHSLKGAQSSPISSGDTRSPKKITIPPANCTDAVTRKAYS